MNNRKKSPRLDKFLTLMICAVLAFSIFPVCNTYAVENNNTGVPIEAVSLGLSSGGKIVKGIVENNNPQLGYITLYNEDGTGSSLYVQQAATLRTYTYTNQKDIEIFRNHEKADIDDIIAGDSVFIRVGNDGEVLALSAVENYTVKFGRVISKRSTTLAVEYDNGDQQVLDITDDVLLVENGRLASYSSLKDGDRVRLILHISGRFTRVKEITVEGDEHYITNVYKGVISYVDDTFGKLLILNAQTLDGGQWTRIGRKGFISIKLSREYGLYSDNKLINAGSANKYLKNSEAYIAVEKDYGGEEYAVLVSFRNEDDTEMLYDDSISRALPGTGKFSLNNRYENILLGAGSIIVKDGRLVSGNSLSNNDSAYVVVDRSYGSGAYNAGVVWVKDRSNAGFVQIYRARVKGIVDSKEFTVDSFSQLKGLIWEFSNTPKTFKITYDTRVLDEDGLINQRNFVGNGENSFVDRVIYIIADGINAVTISTAPYGAYNVQGEVSEMTGGTIGEEGTVLEEPTGLSVRNAMLYDMTLNIWVQSKDMVLNILKNSIVIKDNKIVKPSDLRKYDHIRAIKKENTNSGDAFIIIVED